MSEFAGFDLDRSTERAWSRFQARLADHIADMSDDDVLVVSAESAVTEDDEGSAPYVQFCAWGQTLVRSEVSSNEYLADEVQLDDVATSTIEGLGWSAPTASRDDDDPGEGSANFYLDTERSQADLLAVMTCRAMRDVFGVAHPAFLSAGSLSEGGDLDLGIPTTSEVMSEPVVEAPAVFPRDRDHLVELVDQALTPYFGGEPRHDEDDDIPVVSGSALVFVRVMERVPAIELFCSVVHGIADLDRGAFEVAVLNRDETFLKFVLVEDSVMAYIHLPAYPFAPEHLRAMLTVMSGSVDRLDDDLARRVGGRRTFETHPTPGGEDSAEQVEDEVEETAEAETDAIHPAMMTLLQLDADAPGSITPELAASVCAMDRELILELITWNSEQEIAWRQARDQALMSGDTDEADVCDHETTHAEQTVNLLRRSLRLVVEQTLDRDLGASPYAVARRLSPRSRRRERDSALPGLDASTEEPGLFDQP